MWKRTAESVQALQSGLDASVNFTRKGEFPGFLESRYVRRPDADHFTCYLSTQTGCRQGCRMCHLTTTKQTDAEDAFQREILEQADLVLDHYDELQSSEAHVKPFAVHYSFMARGEPLTSRRFLADGDETMQALARRAAQRRLLPRFLVSTIMPKSLRNDLKNRSLASFFRMTQPLIYYSIYSVQQEFRQKWLPNAMPVEEALTILKRYQDETGRIVKLHWSIIANENDQAAGAIADEVDGVGLRVDVNLVRYNPPEASDDRGAEASEEAYQATAQTLRKRWPLSRIKIVPRVGYDVFASCGMFVR